MDHLAFAYTDLSTGENKVTLLNKNFDEVLNEISLLGAKESCCFFIFNEEWKKKLGERLVVTFSIEDEDVLKEDDLSLVIDVNEDKLKSTCARLFNYLYRTQKRSLDHLQPV